MVSSGGVEGRQGNAEHDIRAWKLFGRLDRLLTSIQIQIKHFECCPAHVSSVCGAELAKLVT